MIFPTFPVCSKIPNFSLAGKYLPIVPVPNGNPLDTKYIGIKNMMEQESGEYPLPKRDLVPEIPTHPKKGHGTRETHPQSGRGVGTHPLDILTQKGPGRIRDQLPNPPPGNDMGPEIPTPREQKDICENITFPQLCLRAIKMAVVYAP